MKVKELYKILKNTFDEHGNIDVEVAQEGNVIHEVTGAKVIEFKGSGEKSLILNNTNLW